MLVTFFYLLLFYFHRLFYLPFRNTKLCFLVRKMYKKLILFNSIKNGVFKQKRPQKAVFSVIFYETSNLQ